METRNNKDKQDSSRETQFKQEQAEFGSQKDQQWKQSDLRKVEKLEILDI